MSKENKKNTEVTEVKEEKIVTKYDKKMQKRRAEARKDARNKKIFKITSIVVLLVAFVTLVTATVINVNRIYREYIKIGDESVSQIEFDMYYSLTKTNVVSQTLYGDMTYLDYFVSYLGYDTSKSDKVQDYSDKYTWFDYFGNSTLNTIKEYKALNKLADENNFDYKDADADYEKFVNDMKSEADKAELSLGAYYKQVLGKHATKANSEKYVREYLRALAYSDAIYEEKKATDDEIKKYYEEHKDDYDMVTYHSAYIKAEKKDDEASLKDAMSKAEQFKKVITSEDVFKDKVVDYVASGDVETYKKDNATLMKDVYKSHISSDESDWLFNKDRKAGDKTIIADEDNDQYQVLYFVKRAYDDANDDSIASTLYANKYSELIKPYTEAMKVEDKQKRITIME